MRVGIDLTSTEGCCGVTQLHGFSETQDYNHRLNIRGQGDTLAEAYKDLFDSLQSYKFVKEDYGPVCQIWFQKNRRHDGTWERECVAEDLRVLIETIEGCVFLGEFVNPNSGNKIMGYQWLAS